MPRTRDTHAHHIRSLQGPLNSHSSVTYGLTRDSCLNSSSYFHVTEGLAPDIMHDVLEGVAQYEVNWWRTPAEFPDLNPVENLWHKLKKYVRRAIKPRTKQELIWGILQFWDTVDIAKCQRYIRHLKKVVPQVISN